MIFFSNTNRPFEYGPYPLERLRRDSRVIAAENERPRISRLKIAHSSLQPTGSCAVLGDAIGKYHDIYRGLGKLKDLPTKAPVPDNLHRRMVDIKGAGYFLDVAHVGICGIPKSAWLVEAEVLFHSHAIVIRGSRAGLIDPARIRAERCKPLPNMRLPKVIMICSMNEPCCFHRWRRNTSRFIPSFLCSKETNVYISLTKLCTQLWP